MTKISPLVIAIGAEIVVLVAATAYFAWPSNVNDAGNAYAAKVLALQDARDHGAITNDEYNAKIAQLAASSGGADNSSPTADTAPSGNGAKIAVQNSGAQTSAASGATAGFHSEEGTNGVAPSSATTRPASTFSSAAISARIGCAEIRATTFWRPANS